MNSLFFLLLGHALAETVLVTDKLSYEKLLGASDGKDARGAYLRHGLIVLLVMLGALLLAEKRFSPFLLVACALMIATGHLLVDLGENLACLRRPLLSSISRLFGAFPEPLYRLLVSAVAQALHLFWLWGVTRLFFGPRYFLHYLTWFYEQHLLGRAPLPEGTLIPYAALLLVVATFGAADFIRRAIELFNPGKAIPRAIPALTRAEEALQGPQQEVAATAEDAMGATAQEEAAGIGRWIGILERLLVIILVAMNAWQGIAFVFTAKSIARYRQLDQRAFAEYYIVGTLLSIIIGILFGLLMGRGLGTLPA